MSSPSDSMTFCMLRDLTSCEKDSTVLTHARTHVRAHAHTTLSVACL